MKRTIAIAAAASALLAGGWVAAQQSGQQSGQPEQSGMQGMDQAMAQMMAEMQRLGEPGSRHDLIKKMEGNWDITAKFFVAPGAPPEISRGTSRNTMVLGGRQLKSEVELTFNMMGEETTFRGIGMMGYDNASGQFQSVWTDTMVTGMMFQTGWLDDGKIVLVGSTVNAMGPHSVKNVYEFVDGGYNLEFYETGEATDGKLMHTGTIEYRK
jgi:hypothetical protein